jgi:hypothetical protein
MTEFIKLVIISFWDTLAEMAPYLLFGFLVAGILSALVSQSVVEKHLGGKGMWPILKASLFGVPLPLCSCGVIPVSMSLYKHGASRGSTVAFLLSTPQTGLDNIFITFSLLGPVFAIFTPFATFFTGIVGGVLVDIFDNTGSANVPIPPKCTDDCCGGGKTSHKLLKGLKHGFITLPADIGKPLFVGLAIAAIIAVVVPDDFFADKLGTGIFAMLVMMALGIPVYVCASASVPMAAAMIMKGLSPGAALVFLMTGPATNAASFITIWKILGSRTAIIYLISVAGCALGAGLLLDYIGTDISAVAVSHVHQMIPAVVNQVSALVLLGVLAFALFKNKG